MEPRGCSRIKERKGAAEYRNQQSMIDTVKLSFDESGQGIEKT